VATLNKKKLPRMLRLEDARVGGSAAVREGGSTPATPTQQGTMFGAKDAAAEFRIKVSSQMRLEHADAQEVAIYMFTYKIFGNINFIA